MSSSFDMFHFLKIYEQQPCLWDRSIPEYRDRLKRDQAERSMLQALHLDDVKMLRTKIRSVRGTYNNEIRKIKNSIITGSGLHEMYRPKLQWFELAHSFLGKNQDSESPTCTNFIVTYSDEEQSAINSIEESVETEVNQSEAKDVSVSLSPVELPSRKRKASVATSRTLNKKYSPLQKAVTALKQLRSDTMNEFLSFGHSVATQLMKLPPPVAARLQSEIQTLISQAKMNHYNSISGSS